MQPTAPAPQPEAQPQPTFLQEIGGSTADFFDELLQGPQPQAQPPQAAEPEPNPEPQPAEQTEAQPPQETAPPQAEPTVEDLIEEFRHQHPEATEQVLKRMADKEVHIRKQSKQITELLARVTKKEEAAAAPAAPADSLTPFERTLREPPAPQPQPAVQPPAQPAAPQPQPVAQPAAQPQPEMPEYLRTPEAAYNEFATAMAEGNFAKAHEVQQNIFQLQMRAFAPNIQQLVQSEAQRLVQEQLGDVIPVMRQQTAARQVEQNREFAIQQLEQGGVQDIRAMFKADSDQPLVVDGQEYDNSPINRAMAQYPWLTRITVPHQDPTTAQRLTLIERYRAAVQMARGSQPAVPTAQAQPVPQPTGIPADQARQLMAAGADLARREQEDRARQAINSGPGATALAGSPVRSFIEEIGGGRSAIDDILNPSGFRR